MMCCYTFYANPSSEYHYKPPNPPPRFCSNCGDSGCSLCCQCALCLGCCSCPPECRIMRRNSACCPCPANQGSCCSRSSLPCFRPCPCPPSWPVFKRVHSCGQPLVPGYQGHVPGLRHHGAGRTFGSATRDTICVMGEREKCCPRLPLRIWEQ